MAKKSSLVALSSSFSDRLEAEWFAQAFKALIDDGAVQTHVGPTTMFDGKPSKDWWSVSVAPKHLKRAEDFRAGMRALADLKFFQQEIERYASNDAEKNAGKEASQLECLGRARWDRYKAQCLRWDAERGRAPIGWEALVEGHEKSAQAYEDAAKLHPRYPEIPQR